MTDDRNLINIEVIPCIAVNSARWNVVSTGGQEQNFKN